MTTQGHDPRNHHGRLMRRRGGVVWRVSRHILDNRMSSHWLPPDQFDELQADLISMGILPMMFPEIPQEHTAIAGVPVYRE